MQNFELYVLISGLDTFPFGLYILNGLHA